MLCLREAVHFTVNCRADWMCTCVISPSLANPLVLYSVTLSSPANRQVSLLNYKAASNCRPKAFFQTHSIQLWKMSGKPWGNLKKESCCFWEIFVAAFRKCNESKGDTQRREMEEKINTLFCSFTLPVLLHCEKRKKWGNKTIYSSLLLLCVKDFFFPENTFFTINCWKHVEQTEVCWTELGN